MCAQPTRFDVSPVQSADEIANVSRFSGDKPLHESKGDIGSIVWITNDVGYHCVEARVTFRDGTTAVSAPLHLDVKSQ